VPSALPGLLLGPAPRVQGHAAPAVRAPPQVGGEGAFHLELAHVEVVLGVVPQQLLEGLLEVLLALLNWLRFRLRLLPLPLSRLLPFDSPFFGLGAGAGGGGRSERVVSLSLLQDYGQHPFMVLFVQWLHLIGSDRDIHLPQLFFVVPLSQQPHLAVKMADRSRPLPELKLREFQDQLPEPIEKHRLSVVSHLFEKKPGLGSRQFLRKQPEAVQKLDHLRHAHRFALAFDLVEGGRVPDALKHRPAVVVENVLQSKRNRFLIVFKLLQKGLFLLFLVLLGRGKNSLGYLFLLEVFLAACTLKAAACFRVLELKFVGPLGPNLHLFFILLDTDLDLFLGQNFIVKNGHHTFKSKLLIRMA
jgi:hypothetical protein